MHPSEWPPIIQAIAAGLVLIIGAIASAIVLILRSQAETRAKLTAVQTTATAAAASAKAVEVTTTTNNSGSHILDKIEALGETLERVEAEQQRQARVQESTASDIRGLRRDVGRLHDVDREDRERAESVHRDLWAAIRDWMAGTK